MEIFPPEALDQVLPEQARSDILVKHEENLFLFLRHVYGRFCAIEEAFTDAVIRWWRETSDIDEANSAATLFRIAVQEADKHFRPYAEIRSESLTSPCSSSLSAAPSVTSAESLERSLRFMPMEYRMMVVLVDMLGYSRETAAQIVELNGAGASEVLSRARRMIRRTLFADTSGATIAETLTALCEEHSGEDCGEEAREITSFGVLDPSDSDSHHS